MEPYERDRERLVGEKIHKGCSHGYVFRIENSLGWGQWSWNMFHW